MLWWAGYLMKMGKRKNAQQNTDTQNCWKRAIENPRITKDSTQKDSS
jgi:hypothetical protein